MQTGRKPEKSFWIVVAIALCAWAAYIAASGGFFVRVLGWRLSSRDPIRPLLVAACVVGFARWRRGPDGFKRDLAGFPERFHVAGYKLAWLAGSAALVLGLLYGTMVAGGADAYGYLSQARLWARGQIEVPQPLAGRVPWPDPEWTLAPLGYRPATTPGAIVPIYAPGLPLLMAAVSFVHADLVFVIVPLAGAVFVILSFHLGRALAGPSVGALTVALVATSPAFLFQLMWPMSDVPVAAAWTAALVLALQNRPVSWMGAGLASSMAVLIRPNTVPVAAALASAAVVGGRFALAASWRRAILNLALYLAGVLPGIFTVIAIHATLYGSPVRSGYGDAADLYALANAGTNVNRYLTWLVETETPVVFFAVVALAGGWRSSRRGWVLLVTALYVAVVWLCYTFYRPFNDWSYLRFLLPAFPAMLALVAAGLLRSLTWPSSWLRTWGVVLILMPFLAYRIGRPITLGIFGVWQVERRYVDTGTYVRLNMPENAVFLSMQQSGSLRYYADRLTIRWDYLEPEWLDRSIDVLKDLGLKPYFLLEEPEESYFRGRFSKASRLGLLNWKPDVQLATDPVVRIYDPDDGRR